MLTTMLEPYDIEDDNFSGLKVQAVSYYSGRDVEPMKLLNISSRLDTSWDYAPLAAWLNIEEGFQAVTLQNVLKNINFVSKQLYSFYKNTDPRGLGDVWGSRDGVRSYDLGARIIMHQLHLFCSFLLFRANRIKPDFIDSSPAIVNWHNLYRLVRTGNNKAKELRDFIFKDDQDGLMEKLVVEVVIMHDLASSINSYAYFMPTGSQSPILAQFGPPRDRGYDCMLHNHALPQIMAGIDLLIDGLGMFKA